MKKADTIDKYIKNTEFYRIIASILNSTLSLIIPFLSTIIFMNIVVSLENFTDFVSVLVIIFLSFLISFASIIFIFKIDFYKCNKKDFKFLLIYFFGHSLLIAISILYLYSVVFRLDNVLINLSIIKYMAYLILPYILIVLPLFSAKLLFMKNKTGCLIKNRIENIRKY